MDQIELAQLLQEQGFKSSLLNVASLSLVEQRRLAKVLRSSIDAADAKDEPLMTRSLDRFSLFPIKYPQTHKVYKKARMVNWEVEEIDLKQDVADFNNLKEPERHFIKTVLAFFQPADGIVAENLCCNFYSKITVPEYRLWYGYQIANEGVHAETYATLIDTLIPDLEERKQLLNAVTSVSCVKRKTNWAVRWIEEGSFAETTVAFAAVECIFFSAAFCSIYWLKKRGLMPGLTYSNDLISRDENSHGQFATDEVWPNLVNKPLLERVKEIITNAVECEHQFVDDALPVALIGMNAGMMKKYVEYVADDLAVRFGLTPIYGTKNPFEWMDMMGLPSKTSFFEKRVADYNRGGCSQPVAQAAADNDSEGEFSDTF